MFKLEESSPESLRPEPQDSKEQGRQVAALLLSGGVKKFPLIDLLESDDVSFDVPNLSNEREARDVGVLTNFLRVHPTTAEIFERPISDTATHRTVFVRLPSKR